MVDLVKLAHLIVIANFPARQWNGEGWGKEAEMTLQLKASRSSELFPSAQNEPCTSEIFAVGNATEMLCCFVQKNMVKMQTEWFGGFGN